VLRPHGDYLTPMELDAITWHAFVFARARPEDKIQIVKSFQRQNFVVGMTGDGVNDAPALRQANIGIAMGITGSEVAKAASDMILTDDKFSSIVDAVELGRTIYGNLRKFVMYLIGSNWTQVLVILVSIIIGIPTPLEPLQILFINLITDGMPAIALSIEAPESDVMRERPRKKDEKILSGHIVNGIIGHAVALMSFMIFVFLLGLWWNTGRIFLANMTNEDGDLISTCDILTSTGKWIEVKNDYCLLDGLKEARTMVFLTIALSECLRPLTARSFSLGIFDEMFRNKHMTYAILASMSCIFFITYVPVVKDIFHLKAPSWFEWLLVLVGVLLTIFADEQLKNQLRGKREKERKWTKLFTRMQALQIELRNIRSHVSRVEEGIPPTEEAKV
jgi:P-type Ca2+ transporter type 2C